jgi:CXXC-20-CXXC protein
MVIQKCENCGTGFKYKSLLKSFWFGKGYVDCTNCGSQHSQIGISRVVFYVIIAILPIIFRKSIVSLLSPNIILILLLYFIYAVLIMVLIPYIIRYKLST